MEKKSSKSKNKAANDARNAELVRLGELTRNQAPSRTSNRQPPKKKSKASRADVQATLKEEDQAGKDNAEHWLQLCDK